EKVAKGIAKRAGITRIAVTVHVYRKTFVTVMYRKTKNILMVSKLAGHSGTDTTIKYYLVDDLDDMQNVYNIANG
ncbi:MAG: tyrosine-type recombinase/integrase, partial [Acetatifactor muris]|nr:tyrosine-type recombinase/integrase [Acetatifactor muris]